MDSTKIIDAVGGRKAVIEMTGLTRGRISQWVVANEIPKPWCKFFQAKFPKLNWPDLLADRRHIKRNRVTPTEQQFRESTGIGMRVKPRVRQITK